MLGTEYTIIEKEIDSPQQWLVHFVDGSSIETRRGSITDKIWQLYNYNLYTVRREAWNRHRKILEEKLTSKPYNFDNNPLILSMVNRSEIGTGEYHNPKLRLFIIPNLTPPQLYTQLTTGPPVVKRNKALDWRYDAAFRGISLQSGPLARILYYSANPTHSKVVFPWLKNTSVWLVSRKGDVEPFRSKVTKKVSDLTQHKDVQKIIEEQLKNPSDVWEVMVKYEETYEWRVNFEYDLLFGGIDFDRQQNRIIYWSWKPKQSRRVFPFINDDEFFDVRKIQWIPPAHRLGEHVVYKMPDSQSKLISVIGWERTGKDQLQWLTPQRFGSILKSLVEQYHISRLSIVWPFGDGISLNDAKPYLGYTRIPRIKVTVYKTVTPSGTPIPYVPRMADVIDLDDLDTFLDEIVDASSTEFIEFYRSSNVFLPDTVLSYPQLQTDKSTLEELTGNDYNDDQVFVAEEYQEERAEEEEEEEGIEYGEEPEEEEE